LTGLIVNLWKTPFSADEAAREFPEAVLVHGGPAYVVASEHLT